MYPRLSPDGTKVAFVRVPTINVGDYYVVPITGGPPLRLTTGEIQIGDLMWSPDSSRIMFYSGHSRELGDRLVSVSAGGGEIKPEPVYAAIGFYVARWSTCRSCWFQRTAERHHLACFVFRCGWPRALPSGTHPLRQLG